MDTEKIIRMIMKRDELTHDEAAEIVNEARDAILEAATNDDYNEAENIMEMDYILDLI